MNTETNHLINIQNKSVDELKELKELGYEEVPKKLSRAAKSILKNKEEAYVSFKSGGKLATWAKKKRKIKNRLTKNSRRNNRK